MEDVHFIFRVLAASQALLLTAVSLTHARHQNGLLIAVTGIAFCCYLTAPFHENAPVAIGAVAGLVANVLPSILWLLAHWLLRDHENVPLWLIVVTAIYAGLMIVPVDALAQWGSAGFSVFVLEVVPQMIKLGLVLHVIFLSVSEREDDLIDTRRRWRSVIAGGGALLAAVVIVVEIWAGGVDASGRVPLVIDALGAILFFILALMANTALLGFRLDLGSKPKPIAPISKTQQPEVVTQVLEAVELGRAYARHGLTLTQLATDLQLPVSKLRDVINRQLGYRNFNQFLNHYRIREAAERLRSEPGLPILTIALDVGFKSLSSFNAAFRKAHDCTPTAYRGG